MAQNRNRYQIWTTKSKSATAYVRQVQVQHRWVLPEQFVKPFAELKRKYLVAHHAEKVVLRAQVDEVRQTILSHACPGEDGFVWGADFAEVFIGGGFDVVLANPPYVRMELFKEIKPILKKNFPSIHSDRTDLYCYFYARAVELLRRNGCLAFISSAKWLRSGYGGKLRSYMGTQTNISSIIDFGDLPVFESASAYPMIFVAQKGSENKAQSSMWVWVLLPPVERAHRLLAQLLVWR